MTRLPLQRAIEFVARTGDFAALAGYVADDVELDIAIAADAPAALRRSGRFAVLEQLRHMGHAAPHAPREPRELFADGERIVALCDGGFVVGNLLAIRSECALVFDVRGESITRIGIQIELHPAVQSTARDHRSLHGLVTVEA